MRLARAFALCLLGCGGCAHLPDGKVSYYLSETKVRLKVIQSVACDKDNRVVSSSAVTPTITYGADVGERKELSYAALRSIFADSDVKVELYEDGRLKAINSTLVGHAEEIFKTITSIASIAATARVAPFGGRPAAPTSKPLCDFINEKAGGKHKAISITYEGDADPRKKLMEPQDLRGDAVAQAYGADLGTVATACVRVESVDKPPKPFVRGAGETGSALVLARQPAQVLFSVRMGTEKDKCADEVWSARIPVGQLGIVYELPLQKAPLFGTQTTALTFHDSGAVTVIQYASKTGTGQALNVVNDALGAVQNHTQKQADAINAEINLIQAQQRLVKCRADPSTCQ